MRRVFDSSLNLNVNDHVYELLALMSDPRIQIPYIHMAR
jgi:hypothetical protein